MADGRIPATVSFGGFKDFNSVSKWAWGVMGWAVENGIVTGVQKPDGAYLAGQSGCTRAEFATMLRRVEDKYGAPDKPVDPDQGGTGGGTTTPDQGGSGGSDSGNTGGNSDGNNGGGSTDKPTTPTNPKPGDVDPVTGKVWGVVKPAWTEKTEHDFIQVSDGSRWELSEERECYWYCFTNGFTSHYAFEYITVEHPAEYGWI